MKPVLKIAPQCQGRYRVGRVQAVRRYGINIQLSTDSCLHMRADVGIRPYGEGCRPQEPNAKRHECMPASALLSDFRLRTRADVGIRPYGEGSD